MSKNFSVGGPWKWWSMTAWISGSGGIAPASLPALDALLEVAHRVAGHALGEHLLDGAGHEHPGVDVERERHARRRVALVLETVLAVDALDVALDRRPPQARRLLVGVAVDVADRVQLEGNAGCDGKVGSRVVRCAHVHHLH